MARTARQRTGLRLVVLAGTLGILFGVLPAAPVLAATDKLPDLKVAKMAHFSIQRTASGRRLLRFDGMMLNVGKGPFEIRGRRASTKKPWIVDQIVYRTGGTKRRVRTTATMKYAGDGHNHWHVRRMLSYHIWSTHGTSRDAKIGFCFFDTNRRNTTLPGAPKFRKYQQSGCGKRGSLHTTNGISVGWGDLYPANFAFQWIDITGFARRDLHDPVLGRPVRQVPRVEREEQLHLGQGLVQGHGQEGQGGLDRVEVPERPRHTPYAADIDWAAEQRIAGNCDADMFCTYDPITRAQLASYLARAMDLPPSDTDFFTDDNGNAREADINRVAAAGLFLGCGAGTFCPSGTVTRGSMATILVRAKGAPATEADYFTDDETNGHEADINAAAEAGLMTGCTATTFCPARKVTRGAAMRLLHTIFGAEPPPADEASLDGAFTDADPGMEATLAVARFTRKGAATEGALAAWAVPTAGDGVASAPLMECPIVRADEADIG